MMRDGHVRDLERRKPSSTAEKIADAVYEAATDESDKVTYLAGDDAKANYAQRPSWRRRLAGIDVPRNSRPVAHERWHPPSCCAQFAERQVQAAST